MAGGLVLVLVMVLVLLICRRLVMELAGAARFYTRGARDSLKT